MFVDNMDMPVRSPVEGNFAFYYFYIFVVNMIDYFTKNTQKHNKIITNFVIYCSIFSRSADASVLHSGLTDSNSNLVVTVFQRHRYEWAGINIYVAYFCCLWSLKQ